MTEGKGRFGRYLALELSVLAVGLLAAAFLPLPGAMRSAALVGVLVSGVSGGLVLGLKRWGLGRPVTWAVGMVGLGFAVRLLALAAGAAVVVARGMGMLPFIAGFFGVYVVLQWLEISYVLASAERGRGGG